MSKKRIIFFMVMIGLVVGAWWSQRSNYDGITIGIIQTASHPALDMARAEFEKTVEYAFHKPVRFFSYNAQNSTAQAHMIAQQLHARAEVDAIFVLGTLSAQVIVQAETEKPICFAAVTNPQAAGICRPNVCGASDAISVQRLYALVVRLFPNAHRIAILFNTSEKNATFMARELQEYFEQEGRVALSCGVSSEAELPTAIVKACTADVIVSPIDNMVAATAAFIAQHALEARIPFIVSDISLVPKGAFAGMGVNYKAVGRTAGECLIQVLRHAQPPADVPIVYATNTQIVINKAVAYQLEYEISEQLDATII